LIPGSVANWRQGCSVAKNISFQLDTRVLDRLIRESPQRATAVVKKLAFDIQAKWMTSMSDTSPSAPNTPPAVVTGNLKNSSSVAMRSQFTAEFRVGADYITKLEFGTMNIAPRPSVVPAFEAVAKNAPEELKAVVEVK